MINPKFGRLYPTLSPVFSKFSSCVKLVRTSMVDTWPDWLCPAKIERLGGQCDSETQEEIFQTYQKAVSLFNLTCVRNELAMAQRLWYNILGDEPTFNSYFDVKRCGSGSWSPATSPTTSATSVRGIQYETNARQNSQPFQSAMCRASHVEGRAHHWGLKFCGKKWGSVVWKKTT